MYALTRHTTHTATTTKKTYKLQKIITLFPCTNTILSLKMKSHRICSFNRGYLLFFIYLTLYTIFNFHTVYNLPMYDISQPIYNQTNLTRCAQKCKTISTCFRLSVQFELSNGNVSWIWSSQTCVWTPFCIHNLLIIVFDVCYVHRRNYNINSNAMDDLAGIFFLL